jgi:hypothetical protein
MGRGEDKKQLSAIIVGHLSAIGKDSRMVKKNLLGQTAA